MNFYDIPNRIESDVVRRAVCAVLLAEADEAELMSEDACLYLSSIYDLCGTDYEDMSHLRERTIRPLRRHVGHGLPL